jgi:hypothetical protein
MVEISEATRAFRLAVGRTDLHVSLEEVRELARALSADERQEALAWLATPVIPGYQPPHYEAVADIVRAAPLP